MVAKDLKVTLLLLVLQYSYFKKCFLNGIAFKCEFH